MRIKTISLIGLMLFLNLFFCSANPLPAPQDIVLNNKLAFFIWILVMLSLTALIEGRVFLVFLRKQVVSKARFYLFFWLVHLVSYPLTIGLAFFISGTAGYLPPRALFAEVLPLLAEPFLLFLAFKKLHSKKWLKKMISMKKIALLCLLANMVTFLLGLMLFSGSFNF